MELDHADKLDQLWHIQNISQDKALLLNYYLLIDILRIHLKIHNHLL